MSSKLDYLKRYMSKDDDEVNSGEKSSKKKKKSKKQSTKTTSGFRIIDTNAFSTTTSSSHDPKKLKKKIAQIDLDEDAEERFATQEEKPQIAGIVDDRPAQVIMNERFTTGGWKTREVSKNGGKSPTSSFKIKEEPASPDCHPQSSQFRTRSDSSSSDRSPPRKRQNSSESDSSPPRKRHDSDASPPRKRHDSSDSDASPPRKRHDSDASPPRKRHDSDASPPRKRHDSDASPPRKPHDSQASPTRKRHDSDSSPPRKRVKDSSPASRPPKVEIKIKQEPDDDLSPPRQIKTEPGYDSDMSPPRRIKEEPDSDQSPPRDQMSKTLGGKKAGLQDAKAMKEEMLKLKKKERDTFDKLSSDVSGRNAETKVRGRLKEKESEEREKRESEDRLRKELTSKYEKWNKGLKQLEDQKERVKTVLHEMDKPLARSKDDADLDVHLREIDRMEDPMLEYMKKKKEKRIQASGSAIPQYPVYKGPEPPPNRFGIRPGYRWDGVDRSTGFEKRLFETKNKKKAQAEEAFKWSTEDM